MTDSDAPVPEHPDNGRTRPTDLPQVRIPRQVHQAMVDLEAQLAQEPAAGQLWRLEFDGTVALVYLADLTDEHIVVVPVGEDVSYADDATVVVPADRSPLGFAIGIWTDLDLRLPRYVLDRKLGDLDVDVPDLTAEQPAEVLPTDVRYRYRQRLQEPLQELVDATERLADDDRGQQQPLSVLLRDQGVQPSQLRRAIDTRRARRAFQDQLYLPPTDPAVDVLAELADVDVDEVRRALPRPPQRLWVALHQLQWRLPTRRWAQDRDLPEVVARWRVAEEVGAGQFRRAGDTDTEPDWEQALTDFFRHTDA